MTFAHKIRLDLAHYVCAFLFAGLAAAGVTSCSTDGSHADADAQSGAALATVGAMSGPQVYELSAVADSRDGAGSILDFAWSQDGRETWLTQEAEGKIVFINFWGTWCPPCRREIPDIVEIANENPDVYVVGVAFEKVPDPLATVAKFTTKSNVPYVNVTGSRGLLMQLAGAYGAGKSFPTTIVINKDGKIVDQIIGMRSKPEFMQSINMARGS